MTAAVTPTPVFASYWYFATERQAIFHRRLADPIGPWTADTILARYRFTNAYRASDRVSQYLIREVQYRDDRPQNPRELFFRTLLFKLFNRIETWEAIESRIGPLVWGTLDLDSVVSILDEMYARGERLYSAAYIMPPPQLGHERKHRNHLALLAIMMGDQVPDRIHQAPSLRSVYELILRYPGIGPFLAYQYTIDLNYCDLIDFNESDFVVAGPGARDGIAKCFADTGSMTPEEIIHWTTDQQESEFTRFGLRFSDLFGRRLQPIDCQNLYCEVSKYARIAHPEATGISGRTRIKQSYRPAPQILLTPVYPPRWNLKPQEQTGGIEDVAQIAEPLPPWRAGTLL